MSRENFAFKVKILFCEVNLARVCEKYHISGLTFKVDL